MEMKCTGLIVVVYVCTAVLSPGYSTLAEQCLETFMDLSLVKLRGSRIGLGGERTRLNNEIRIVNSIQFTCPTQIDNIILGIDIRNSRNMYPILQLWRPTSGEGDDDIELVPDSERTIVYTPANVSSTGVYEYPLLPPLNATPGDYLAISQPDTTTSAVRVYTVDEGLTSSYSLNIGSITGQLMNTTTELILVYPITAHPYCVNSSVNKSFVIDKSVLISRAVPVTEQRQYIYPDITFICNGTIHKWIYSGMISNPSETELPELQVWRQTSNGIYNKQGSSKVSANQVLSLNVYELMVDPPIEFMEGDIFGLYQPSMDAFKLYEQRRSGPFTFRFLDSNIDNAPDAINDTMLFDVANDYPLVTVEISVITGMSTSQSLSTINTISTSPVQITSIATTTLPIVQSSPTTTTDTATDNDDAQQSNDSSNALIGIIVGIVLVIIINIVCASIVITVLIWKRNGHDAKSGNTKPNSCNEGQILTILDTVPPTPPDKPPSTPPLYSSINADTMYESPALYSSCDSHQQWNSVVPNLDQRQMFINQCKDFEVAISAIYESSASTGQAGDSTRHRLLEFESKNFFEESNIYWAPGSDYGSLYAQLASKKFREILPSQISTSTMLGSGNFGVVMKGTWNSPSYGGPLPVAIKTVKDGATEDEKLKFLQEAAIMGQFHHPNIVIIYGVVTMSDPAMIVLELMNDGDLLSFLRDLRPSPGEMIVPSVPELLLGFCRQVASAMEYLAEKSFIHRDLAARNVLVTENRICKISDFGMSRDLQEETYYVSKGGQIPVKWTAPEALSHKKYSTASDVWSYGVLMYEIWSLGEKPFLSVTNPQVFRKVCDGYRLPPPPGCPRPLYQIMIECWNPDNGFRPSFSSLVVQLSQNDVKLLEVCLPSTTSSGVHPQASILGGAIEAGEKLYPDLQTMYQNN